MHFFHILFHFRLLQDSEYNDIHEGLVVCLLYVCCCCSVTQSYLTLCDSVNGSMAGFPGHHQLPELAQTHVHWVTDAIQPSHPLSYSVVPFSSCLWSFPASGSFPMSWLLASGSQSIGASASPSVFSVNIQGWFPLELTGSISLLSKGLSRVFFNTTIPKHQFSGLSLLYGPTPTSMGFPGGSVGKESTCNADTWVGKILEKGKATHSNILAWRTPRTIQSMGSQRVENNKWLSLCHIHTWLLEKP